MALVTFPIRRDIHKINFGRRLGLLYDFHDLQYSRFLCALPHLSIESWRERVCAGLAGGTKVTWLNLCPFLTSS